MKVVRNVSETEWWGVVERLGGDITFFQTPLWAQVLAEAFPALSVDTRFYELADGSRVLVPLMRRQRMRGLVATLESMPFGTYGAFLGERALVQKEGLAILAELRRSRPAVGRLMVTPNPLGRFPIPEDVFHCQNFIHFLRLDDGFDPIWRHKFSDTVRRSVRKSIRRGVQVVMETTEAAYFDFCRLYHLTAERWERKPPFGESFFAALARLDERHVQLWGARVEGRMIAGMIVFTHGDHQIPYLGGFDRSFRGYDPNNALHAEAMKWGARNGYKSYNFLSSAGMKGVEQFKSSFGTQRVFFNYYLYENPFIRLMRRNPLLPRRAPNPRAGRPHAAAN